MHDSIKSIPSTNVRSMTVLPSTPFHLYCNAPLIFSRNSNDPCLHAKSNTIGRCGLFSERMPLAEVGSSTLLSSTSQAISFSNATESSQLSSRGSRGISAGFKLCRQHFLISLPGFLHVHLIFVKNLKSLGSSLLLTLRWPCFILYNRSSLMRSHNFLRRLFLWAWTLLKLGS